jgi:hypothetical protein
LSKVLTSPNDLEFKRLSGNSNECYKISLKRSIKLDAAKVFNTYSVLPDSNLYLPTSILYRRYKQQVVDKRVEQAIFKAKSEDKTGPHLYYQNNEFRIEEFFHGRPITLWEMRNPLIVENYAT